MGRGKPEHVRPQLEHTAAWACEAVAISLAKIQNKSRALWSSHA